jgi:hypothetical protein
LDEPVLVLVFAGLVLFAISMYLIERAEGKAGINLPRYLRFAFAILLVFLAYQGWQLVPARHLPQFLSGESRAVLYGVPPLSEMECPGTHPVKGDKATLSVGRCIYRIPGDEPYNRTRPGRCYTSVEEAKQDGCTGSTF